MIVFRLTKDIYSNDLTGEGAKLAGGRWNSKGVPIVYTSESRSLCMFEAMAHIPINLLPNNYKIIKIEIPDRVKVDELKIKNLPPNWDKFPYISASQKIGYRFVKNNKALILKVPSALISESYNYLLNPAHIDIISVKIISKDSIRLDDRIIKIESKKQND